MTNELARTTNNPIVSAIQRANRMRDSFASRCVRNRSTRSDVTTAVIAFTPESMLDIAAANMPHITSPERPIGR